MAKYACSDLHGRYDIYLQICKFLKSEDTIFFLGDANDRGPDGYSLMNSILINPQWVYLKGNHEDLFVKACNEGYDSFAYQILYQNGGAGTYIDWEQDGEPVSIVNKLDWLPHTYTLVNRFGKVIYLSHAGYTPGGNHSYTNDDLLWGREHFKNDWKGESYEYIVHGHTPIEFMIKDNTVKDIVKADTALWYCGGHKVCIDNGACWTNAAILLDLDTFEEILIKGEG